MKESDTAVNSIKKACTDWGMPAPIISKNRDGDILSIEVPFVSKEVFSKYNSEEE